MLSSKPPAESIPKKNKGKKKIKAESALSVLSWAKRSQALSSPETTSLSVRPGAITRRKALAMTVEDDGGGDLDWGGLDDLEAVEDIFGNGID